MWGRHECTANYDGVRKQPHRESARAARTGANSGAGFAPIKSWRSNVRREQAPPSPATYRMGPWRSAAPASGIKADWPASCVPGRHVGKFGFKQGDSGRSGPRPGWP